MTYLFVELDGSQPVAELSCGGHGVARYSQVAQDRIQWL